MTVMHPIMPPPPENVQVMFFDGTVIPVECVYTGQNEDGIECWEAVSPQPEFDYGRIMDVSFGKLPGMTSVSFRCFDIPNEWHGETIDLSETTEP